MRLGAFIGALFICTVLSFMVARIVSIDTRVSKATAQAEEVHAATCAYREGLRLDAARFRKYVEANPKGAFGYTQEELLAQVSIQEKRANSLKGLDC